MVTPGNIGSVFDDTVTEHGARIRMRTYVPAFSGTLYNTPYLTTSGVDIWFQGLHLPVDAKYGGKDYAALQQGRIQINDSKLYIPGSIPIDDANHYKFFIGGSPAVTPVYSLVDLGNITYGISGVDVYKKCYIRILNGGSFVDEY